MGLAEYLLQAWALAPVLSWVAIFTGLLRRDNTVPDAILKASMLWGGGVWLASNGLSLAGAFSPLGLRATWAVVGLVSAGLLWRWRANTKAMFPKQFTWGERGLLLIAAVVLAVAFVRAVAAPPNTVDVLNYHLPRQVLWLQQGGLEHYATINTRENIMPPLAEVIGAQFLGLTGDDRWANFPQAFSYFGLALAVAWLARRMGAERRIALAAGVLALLLPMAHHEASGAKNDLMGAFWTMQAALAVLTVRRGLAAGRAEGAGWLGLAAALAWLTKSTAMIYLPALLVAGLGVALFVARSKAAWRAALVALAVGLLLVAPFHTRNLAGSASLLGEHRAEDGGGQINEAMSPVLLGSNVLRQATLHLMGPSETLNAAWLRLVRGYHEAAGLGLSDRRVTLWTMHYAPEYAPQVETLAGAPLHFLLVAAGLGLVLAGRGGERARNARWLAAAAVGGALLFCLLLKWQPWAARLHLPLLALGLVPVALLCPVGKWAWRAGVAGVVALATLLWWTGADTAGRTLWSGTTLWRQGRESAYYVNLPHLERRDDQLALVIEEVKSRRVMIVNLHDISYPLMRKLRQKLPRIQFTTTWTDDNPPDAAVVLNLGGSMPLYHDVGEGRLWRLVGAGYGEGVYLPVERVRELGAWNRLPKFSGWRGLKGITVFEFRAGDNPSELGRTLLVGRGALAYESRGGRMSLSLDIASLGAHPGTLSLFMREGTEAPMRLDLAQNGITTAEDIELPSSPGWHRLDLWLGDDARKVVITRLVINDLPPERPASNAGLGAVPAK